MRSIFGGLFVLALCACFLKNAAAQQNLPIPEASQAASVSQTVGLTEITVRYHRPGVKGRAIWGGLVPYNEVWRAGANENTTISLSGPVRIGGKDLAAGTYGVHMIPTKENITVILSTNASSWGSYFYNEKEDALRLSVRPGQAPFQEWLSYQFNDITPSSVTLSLRWEKLEIPLLIEVDVPASVVKEARDVYLRGLGGFRWQGWQQAANYCSVHNVNLQEALAWADQSIRMNRNFSNLWVKGVLLEQTGQATEGERTKQEALLISDEASINVLGYQYFEGGNVERALELFTINVKKHPESWNAYDSLGEGYAAAGKTKEAIDAYSKALSMTSDEVQKVRIRTVLKGLGAK
jgi:tetratricopeptide (TPR) repeat protein